VMRLLRAEARRFFARDVVRIFVIAVLLTMGVGAVITAVNSREGDSDRGYRDQLQQCLDGLFVPEDQLPRRYDTLEEYCADHVRPEFFVSDSRFELSSLPEVLQSSAFLVVIGGLLLGASFVGAEWHHGTMTTLLAWEPRRTRVLAAKALVAAVGVFAVMTVLLVIVALMFWGVAALRGITTDLGPHFVRSLGGTILRIAVCSSAGAMVGLGIAMVARSTAAAIGIGFAYLGLVEGLIRALRPGWQHALLADNIAVVITGADAEIMREPVTITHAVVAVAIWAGVMLAAAAVAFRVRDVN
jgi:ABC-type transport system involved in multi-copper enzyme maturation permease subunit